ncbi:hypothetical protein N7513_011745 [Penicillium frequentans]|nr:hypothetical protein N7513_011745 [Penicillium glabrum]
MWKSSIPAYQMLEPALFQTNRCLSCQFRSTRTLSNLRSIRHYATTDSTKKPSDASNAEFKISPRPQREAQPLRRSVPFQQNPAPIPKPSSKPGDADFVPPVLSRPIGAAAPPQVGENTGVDARTIKERRDDFVDYDKHIARRKELTRLVAKPYFREWSNLQYHKGKTFISNPRIFRADKALYFPNLSGITLASPKDRQDTTAIFRGKVSVVNLFCSLWGEEQTTTFTGNFSGEDRNPALKELLAKNSKYAQRVDLNLEENRMKAWLVRRFLGSVRKKFPVEQHPCYFLIEKGFDESLKEAVGMVNKFVGYVYLVDADCRIRWAGSGPAHPDEVEAMHTALEKLIAEQKAAVELESSTRR